MNKICIFLCLFMLSGFYGYGQLGAIDQNFNVGTGFGGGFVQSRVETIIQQSDDKLLVGGWFTDYNGTASNFIARLHLDGSLDNSFNTGSGFSGFSGYVKSIALQTDGRILVGGNYLAFNGITRHRLARLHVDGSLDTTFDPLTGFNSDVNTVAIQADGKIVVAGVFSAYDWLNAGGISRPGIARLNANGSLDGAFDPQLGFQSTTGAQVRVNEVIVQPDGKILACGQFDGFNGAKRILIARLNSDGTLDPSFDAGENFQLIFGFYGEAWSMKLQPDGKILLAGNFSHTGASNSGVIRLNPDGSIDQSFVMSKKATSIGLQSDGKVFVSETGPYSFSRYNSDGSLDASFPQRVFNDIAQTIIIQKDGNVLIGGWFSYNPTGIMRLIGDTPITSTDGLTEGAMLVEIFPNPSSAFMDIRLAESEAGTGFSFTLLNASGYPVRNLTLIQQHSIIDLRALPSGVYIYQLRNLAGKVKVGKVVIE